MNTESSKLLVLSLALVLAGSLLGAEETVAPEPLPRPVAFRLPGGSLRALALSGDGKRLAALADILDRGKAGGKEFNLVRGSEISLWDATTGKQLSKIRDAKHRTALAISADGGWLAAGAFQEVKVWDARTGVVKYTLTGFRGDTRRLGFSPDGSLLVSVSSEMDESDICLWDLRLGRLRHRESEKMQGRSLAFSTDGKTLAVGGAAFGFRGSVRIWDLPAMKLRTTVPAPGASLEHIALSADGGTLAFSRPFAIEFHDARTGKLLLTVKEPGDVLGLTPDGKFLGLTRTTGGSKLRLLDASGRQVRPLMIPHGRLAQFALSADGRWLAVAAEGKGGGLVRVWNLGPPLKAGPGPCAGAKEVKLLSPAAGATLPNGSRGARTVKVWEFSWVPVPGAETYQLVVMGQKATRPLIDTQVRETSFRYSGRGYVAPHNLRGWRWKVRARVKGEWTEWSEERNFDVQPPR